jgi:hypothetical protein
MNPAPRVIFDTNILVSALLRPGSIPDLALGKALLSCDLCACMETLEELTRVLERRKFNRYRSLLARLAFIEFLRRQCHIFPIHAIRREEIVPPCRDEKDNLFLALVLASGASLLVSGDADLLELHPWNGTSIVTASGFLELRLTP